MTEKFLQPKKQLLYTSAYRSTKGKWFISRTGDFDETSVNIGDIVVLKRVGALHLGAGIATFLLEMRNGTKLLTHVDYNNVSNPADEERDILEDIRYYGVKSWVGEPLDNWQAQHIDKYF